MIKQLTRAAYRRESLEPIMVGNRGSRKIFLKAYSREIELEINRGRLPVLKALSGAQWYTSSSKAGPPQNLPKQCH